MLLLLRVQRYTAFSEKPNFRERKSGYPHEPPPFCLINLCFLINENLLKTLFI